MADKKHLAILEQGVEAWNRWRDENPDLTPNLERAHLTMRKDNRALRGANLSGCYLVDVDFDYSDLQDADLSLSNFTFGRFVWVDARGVNFHGANLSQSIFLKTDLRGANLSGANVYGASAWDLTIDETTQQQGLVITAPSPWETGGEITVDDFEVAQFIYLLLNNQKIRDVIDTVTSKAVLILGRFTKQRKPVLDSLRDALRHRGYVPILFDFTPSSKRDLTETIQLLANMAKFVVADLTDAKSIPQELSHIIPFLPSVPIQPIILASARKYAMYEHWEKFDSVLPDFAYDDELHLINNLEDKVIKPAETWETEKDETRALRDEIKELKAKLAQKERS